jgi:predicted aconitase
MSGVELTPEDEAMLAGRRGDGTRLAMSIIVRTAAVQGARRLRSVTGAHIDSCLYHGRAGLDFARRLVAGGARVSIPTTLNVSSLDLLHPHLYRGDAATAAEARNLMDLYVEMGCRATWTCAPYQLVDRPTFGEHVAWAESNAIVFCNSVIGARTDRYGDFIDICAAVTGRVPDAGLHRSENRKATLLFRLDAVGADHLLDEDAFYPVLGHLIGRRSGHEVPAIEGLPAAVSEDRLKALGAAAASSGAVGLFHAIGITPEAPSLDAVAAGSVETIDVGRAMLRTARDELTSTGRTDVTTVSLGTPHASLDELARIATLFGNDRVHDNVDFYVSTARDVLARAEDASVAGALRRVGVQVVTDTCTYITPILKKRNGVAMTDSAKWAWYAPGNLGVEVIFATTRECVRSGIEGRVWRDTGIWN